MAPKKPKAPARRAKRGRYGGKAKAPPVPRVVVEDSTRLGWIDLYIRASPIKDPEVKRTLAENLATARATVAELGSLRAIMLTDGMARLLSASQKAVIANAEALGVLVDEKPSEEDF